MPKQDLSFLPDQPAADLSFLPDKPVDISFLPDKPKTTIPVGRFDPRRILPQYEYKPTEEIESELTGEERIRKPGVPGYTPPTTTVGEPSTLKVPLGELAGISPVGISTEVGKMATEPVYIPPTVPREPVKITEPQFLDIRAQNKLLEKKIETGAILDPKELREFEKQVGKSVTTREPAELRTPPVERIVKGYGTGIAGMIKGTGGSLKWLGADTLGKSISDYGEKMRKYYEVPDPDFITNLSAGVGSMSTFLIPGMGIAKGAKALSFAPKLASWLGATASATMEAMTEAGSGYEEALQRGLPENEASGVAHKIFWANLPLITFTNKYGLFGNEGNAVLKSIASASGEGVQEFTQEVISNIALKDPTFQNAVESGLIGAIIGGGAGLVTGTLEKIDTKRAKKKVTETKPPEVKPTIPEKTLKEIRIVEGKEIPVYEQKAADTAIPEMPKVVEPAEESAPGVAKPAIPKELEPLVREAKKYKTAEEFLDKVYQDVQKTGKITKTNLDVREFNQLVSPLEKKAGKLYPTQGWFDSVIDIYNQAVKGIEPAPTISPITPEQAIPDVIPENQYKSIIEQQGAKFEGISHDAEGKPALIQFTDPQTKSTLALTPEQFNAENVKNRIEATRLKFEQAKKPMRPATPALARAEMKAKKEAGIISKTAEEIRATIPPAVPPVGLGIKKTLQPPIKDEIILPKDEKITFTDPGLEQSFQAAKGITPANIFTKIKEGFTQFWHTATRVYPELPNTPQYAKLRDILYKQKGNKTVAQYDALTLLRGITDKIGKKQLDLFTRKIILDDLTYDAERNMMLPFGFTNETLKTEKARIDKITAANPIIQEAITKRKTILDSIAKDLIKYDIIIKEQAKNPNFFHHQVLAYADAKELYEAGKKPGKLKRPAPGFAKHRVSSQLAINTDYLQAEYEYISQAYHDIQTAKNLEQIKNSELNIKDKLKEQYGDKWRDNVPEGYQIWQPREGRVFYTILSIPEQLLDNMLDKVLTKELLEQIKKTTAVGVKFKELVLPEAVAKTLDNLYVKPTTGIAGEVMDFITKKPVSLWKRWVLFNPVRLVKYNYQNTLGDIDAILTANPAALKKIGTAISDLYDYYYGNRPMSEDLYEAFTKQVISSGLTMEELPEIQDVTFFKKFNESKFDWQKLNLIKNWFQFAGKASTFRENILRYAAYLDYRDRFRTGNFGSMWILKYGAAKPSEVDALSTPEDKAAKVATATLGDYGSITALGQEFRSRLIPFFSWTEVNFKRYPQMLANAYTEGKAGGIAGASRTAAHTAFTAAKIGSKVGTWVLRATALTAIASLWNNWKYPDIEDELNEYDQRRMHINIGRDKKGRPIILRGQGALSDFLEWGGLNEAPRLTRLLMEDKINLGYALKQLAKAPVNKLFGGISPSYKIPVEYLMGVSLFPDILEPRAVRDKNRNFMKNFQMEDIYDWVTGKPQRPLVDILRKFTPVVVTDAESNAYYEIQNLKRLYLESKGKGKFSNTFFTPRSEVMYNYKVALKYKDEKAIKKYGEMARELRIKPSEINKGLNPLAGLSIREQYEFRTRYLNDEDKRKFDIANKYYKELVSLGTAGFFNK